ncbi:hypothetical protein LTR85_005028 [Meristemomyces frigidus]|nr:hypothetical protein LTR85_005028 [Meristemomyces frigidus]
MDGCEGRPLPEDYSIRGLVWAYFLFSPGWFDVEEDEFGRTIETASTHKARAERAVYHGLRLAFETEYMEFDLQSRTFSAVGDNKDPINMQTATYASSTRHAENASTSTVSSPPWSSAPLSSSSDSDFVHVRRPAPNTPQKPAAGKMQKPARSWAAVASVRKPRHDNADVQVVDPDRMEWGT